MRIGLSNQFWEAFLCYSRLVLQEVTKRSARWSLVRLESTFPLAQENVPYKVGSQLPSTAPGLEISVDGGKKRRKEATGRNDGKKRWKATMERNDGKKRWKETTERNDGKKRRKETMERNDGKKRRKETMERNDGGGAGRKRGTATMDGHDRYNQHQLT
jgi:hypothetical protein